MSTIAHHYNKSVIHDKFREIEENAGNFCRNFRRWRPSSFVDFRSREISLKNILKKFTRSKLFSHVPSPVTKLSLNIYRKKIIRA